MATHLCDEIFSAWIRLLQDIELARNYNRPYILEASHLMPNPLLESLLPSLLFVRLVSLLDEALIFYIKKKGMSMSKDCKNDLYHRIKFLGERNVLTDARSLQDIRKKRNDIAHEQGKFANWQELESALEQIETELQQLSFVGIRPRYEYYAERSGARKSTDPRVAFSFDYFYGLKEDGKNVIKESWTSNVYREIQ